MWERVCFLRLRERHLGLSSRDRCSRLFSPWSFGRSFGHDGWENPSEQKAFFSLKILTLSVINSKNFSGIGSRATRSTRYGIASAWAGLLPIRVSDIGLSVPVCRRSVCILQVPSPTLTTGTVLPALIAPLKAARQRPPPQREKGQHVQTPARPRPDLTCPCLLTGSRVDLLAAREPRSA